MQCQPAAAPYAMHTSIEVFNSSLLAISNSTYVCSWTNIVELNTSIEPTSSMGRNLASLHVAALYRTKWKFMFQHASSTEWHTWRRSPTEVTWLTQRRKRSYIPVWRSKFHSMKKKMKLKTNSPNLIERFLVSSTMNRATANKRTGILQLTDVNLCGLLIVPEAVPIRVGSTIRRILARREEKTDDKSCCQKTRRNGNYG